MSFCSLCRGVNGGPDICWISFSTKDTLPQLRLCLAWSRNSTDALNRRILERSCSHTLHLVAFEEFAVRDDGFREFVDIRFPAEPTPGQRENNECTDHAPQTPCSEQP